MERRLLGIADKERASGIYAAMRGNLHVRRVRCIRNDVESLIRAIRGG